MAQKSAGLWFYGSFISFPEEFTRLSRGSRPAGLVPPLTPSRSRRRCPRRSRRRRFDGNRHWSPVLTPVLTLFSVRASADGFWRPINIGSFFTDFLTPISAFRPGIGPMTVVLGVHWVLGLLVERFPAVWSRTGQFCIRKSQERNFR